MTRDYEFTAKAIEVLGAELISALKKFEAKTTEGADGVQNPLVSSQACPNENSA